MKKNKLLALLSIPFMVSCGGSSSPVVNPDRPIPDPVDPPKPVHYHDFDSVTGDCSCGLTLATKLEYIESETTYFPFEVHDHKIYFSFETECNRKYYVRNDAYNNKKYKDRFNQIFANIELYKADDLTTDIFANGNYDRVDANVSTSTPFSWYNSKNVLDAETKYYTVITLADFYEEDELTLYIGLYNDHAINDENWVRSDDGTKRTNTFHCGTCDKDVVVEETYILEITLPEFHIIPGKSVRENMDAIEAVLDEYNDEFKTTNQVNNINKWDNYDTPDRDNYVVNMYLLTYYGYAFDKDRTVYKYVDGTEAVDIEYVDHDRWVEFNITVPKVLATE